jgi:hypothetical protein
MVPRDALLPAPTAPSAANGTAGLPPGDAARPGAAPGDRELRRPARMPSPASRRRAPARQRPPLPAPGFIGNSFVLPNGSWYHGRRESA